MVDMWKIKCEWLLKNSFLSKIVRKNWIEMHVMTLINFAQSFVVDLQK